MQDLKDKHSIWLHTAYQVCSLLLLARKQEFLVVKLKASLRKYYDRHHDLVNRYELSVSQMTTDIFRLSYSQFGSFIIHDLSRSL
jgi:hypothetical protein